MYLHSILSRIYMTTKLTKNLTTDDLELACESGRGLLTLQLKSHTIISSLFSISHFLGNNFHLSNKFIWKLGGLYQVVTKDDLL